LTGLYALKGDAFLVEQHAQALVADVLDHLYRSNTRRAPSDLRGHGVGNAAHTGGQVAAVERFAVTGVRAG
jgi:hypothetical protein